MGLLHSIVAGHVLADKAYDSNEVLNAIELMGGIPVIPAKTNRKIHRDHDKEWYKLKEWYKQRNRIERFFCRIKQFRRIATRYDKLSRRFASFVLLVGACVWGG